MRCDNLTASAFTRASCAFSFSRQLFSSRERVRDGIRVCSLACPVFPHDQAEGSRPPGLIVDGYCPLRSPTELA